MTEVQCKVLEWLTYEIENAEPASTDGLGELRDKSLVLGEEAESTLRLTTIHKKLFRVGGAPDEDPVVVELKKQFIEVAKLLDRRLSLGDKAVGVQKFYLHQDRLISKGAPKKA